MSWELQSTLEASGIEWPAMRYHIACMAHIIRLGVGAFMRTLGVKACTKSWEAHECDQQFGENESTVIGKSQRLRKEGNARIHKVPAMRPGLAKITEKVCIWRHFERPEADLHTAENTCCIDHSDTWWLKWVHWLSKCQSTNRITAYYACENTAEFDMGVAWASLLSTRTHTGVAHKSEIQWLPATLPNTGWKDHPQLHLGRIEAIPIVDPVEVKQAYGSSASLYYYLQWLRWSYQWRYESFGKREDSMVGRHILCRDVGMTEAVHIICWSDPNDWYAAQVSSYPWSCPAVAIIFELAQGNAYY